MASVTIDLADGLNSAVAVKGPCRVTTTANITLSGTQTIDSIALAVDDRVLVKDQTNAFENGIYRVSLSAWTRTKDFSRNDDVVDGTTVWVVEGGGKGLYTVTLENGDDFEFDTDDITIERFDPYDVGGIDLDKYGLEGDGSTDDSTLFQAAIEYAESTGIRRVFGRPGSIYKIRDIELTNDIEIDLRGGTLKGFGTNLAGSVRMFTTEEADGVKLTIRNGEIDGGLTTLGASGVGDRTFLFQGGEVSLFDLDIHSLSCRQANASPIALYDPTSHKSGNIWFLNCERVTVERCKSYYMGGEMVEVLSDDATTQYSFYGCTWSKIRQDTGLAGSGSGLNTYTCHPSSQVEFCDFSDFISSPINHQMHGGSYRSVTCRDVSSSSGLDNSEAASLSWDGLVVENCNFYACASGGIRSAGSGLRVTNCGFETVAGFDGILIEGTTGGVTWTGGTFPAGGDRELKDIVLNNIHSLGGGGRSLVKFEGAAAGTPIHAEINGMTHRTGTANVAGIYAEHTKLTLRGGIVNVGSDHLVYLLSSGTIFGEKAQFDPASTSHVLTFAGMAAVGQARLRDCERLGNLGVGKFDINLETGPAPDLVATAQNEVFLTLENSATITTFDGAIGRGGLVEVSIADDEFYSFYPAATSGGACVMAKAVANTFGIIDYRVTGSPFCNEHITRSALDVGTTALTSGTSDGVDGSLNIAAVNDGMVYIKNRTGATRTCAFRHMTDSGIE
jgi:hypothetical protein